MNEKMKKMLDSINAKKAEARAFIEGGDTASAEAAMDELRAMQKKFDMLAELEAEDNANALEIAKEGAAQVAGEEKTDENGAFVNVMRATIKHTPVSSEDAAIVNAMSEGSDLDGGLTVPKDLRTQINELRRAGDALEPLVNVEHVSTTKGSRVIEVEAEQTPFDNVEEAAEFPEVSTPQFRNIKYEIKKKGGILKVTEELLADSTENIIGYMRGWITKKARATRNFMIIKKIKEICKDAEITIAGVDTLKDIFNVLLDPAIATTSSVVTNQSGFNWLDKQKDTRGDYIMQPDPTQPTRRLLFGVYPVKVVSNKTLANVDGKAPIVCGDLKEAITIFDRETLTVDITNLAAGSWETDQTSIKVRERLDIQTVDADAILMGYVTVDGVSSDLNGDGKYSETELNRLTKSEILALAKKKSLTLDATEESTKAEIIADFVAKQN